MISVSSIVRRPTPRTKKNCTVPKAVHRPPSGDIDLRFIRPEPLRWRRPSAGVWLALALSLGGVSGASAEGVDWSLSAGRAQQADVSKLGVIAGWTQPAPLWQGASWRLKLRHEVELSAWHVPKARNLLELGYSPVLRLERPLAGHRRSLFVEASIGVRLLSHTRVAPDLTVSTAFQFSDVLGAGVQWGPEGRSTLGLRYQHLSNLGIKRPNPGIDFVQLYYTHRF